MSGVDHGDHQDNSGGRGLSIEKIGRMARDEDEGGMSQIQQKQQGFEVLARFLSSSIRRSVIQYLIVTNEF